MIADQGPVCGFELGLPKARGGAVRHLARRKAADAMLSDPRVTGMLRLLEGLLRPPRGAKRLSLAFAVGFATHLAFAAGVLSMVTAMFYGMSESPGRVPQPWAWLANAALLVQFPLVHSLLLTRRGTRLLARIGPAPHGETLASSTYALIASLQLLALFALWTPSGIVWWQAEGVVFWVLCTGYVMAWLLLLKASFDAGVEVQSGALGWMSLAAQRAPRFPDMPTRGLFRLIRQPIYVAFALTLWTVPVWTPDQLMLAVGYTAYCLLAPRLKERRFADRYGARFARYRDRVPYAIPRLAGGKDNAQRLDDL